MLALEVLTTAPEPLRRLYSILECEFHPLDMVQCVKPIIASVWREVVRHRWLEQQEELVKYVPQLQRMILFRVLQQLETVYSVMELSSFYALIDDLGLDRFAAERVVTEASSCGQLHIRVDKVHGVVLFNENVTESDVLSNYLNVLSTA